MQLWQMDVVGGVLLDDGTELKVLTGVDDHSRFCIAAGLMRRATSIPVDDEQDHRGQWVLRRVASNGVMSVDNQMFSVTNAFKGALVDVFVDDTVIQVWSKNHLIKTVARVRSGLVRKVRADGLHVKRQPVTKRQASAGT